MTVRTCFRFSGYENPRSLPTFRDLTDIKDVLGGIEDAYKAGEEFAKDNDINWFELGLIIMGGIKADRSSIVIADYESKLCVVEACYGDIHLIAVGEDQLDSYWVNDKGEIVKKKVRDKSHGYYFVNGKKEKRNIDEKRAEGQCLNDEKD